MRELHWLPIRQCIDFKLEMVMHAAVYGTAPEFKPVTNLSGRSHLRSAAHRLFHVLRTRTPFGSRAFSVPLFGSRVFSVLLFRSRVFSVPLFGSRVFSVPQFGSGVFSVSLFRSRVFSVSLFRSCAFSVPLLRSCAFSVSLFGSRPSVWIRCLFCPSV